MDLIFDNASKENKNKHLVDYMLRSHTIQLGLLILHLFQYKSTFTVLKASAHPMLFIQSEKLCISVLFSPFWCSSLLQYFQTSHTLHPPPLQPRLSLQDVFTL